MAKKVRVLLLMLTLPKYSFGPPQLDGTVSRFEKKATSFLRCGNSHRRDNGQTTFFFPRGRNIFLYRTCSDDAIGEVSNVADLFIAALPIGLALSLGALCNYWRSGKTHMSMSLTLPQRLFIRCTGPNEVPGNVDWFIRKTAIGKLCRLQKDHRKFFTFSVYYLPLTKLE